ncbi:sensor histidine kinase [Cognatishimia sp. F0-27]|uniref:sensor histidine kinase n=1 Tax=Cognatishimia sp. F0-27 TaxID=2816855 RepID=UPI001D0C3BD5|nr:sensor histidine kinase [Cognatishimia sp. F0-27]MCC1493867.1 hypothetical protein [Cognatishimia sp. F0-27]
MTLALLPLGIIASLQTLRVVDDARTVNRETLSKLTIAAASDQRNLVQRAIGASSGLGAMVHGMDLDSCRRAMRNFIRNSPQYDYAAFISVEGSASCNSGDAQALIDQDAEAMQDRVARGTVDVSLHQSGGRLVLGVHVPVRDQTGILGFMTVLLPQQTHPASEGERDLILTAVTRSGEPFLVSAPDVEQAVSLPANLGFEGLSALSGQTFVSTDQSGELRLFAVTASVADSYLVVGSWPQEALVDNGSWLNAAMPVVFALLMWATGMIVAYLGLNRMVIRHLAALRSAMRQFALGQRDGPDLVLDGAPDEFQDAQRAFNRMTLIVTEADAQRVRDLKDKEVLLREVHHRVKNNLQMIASIMNLQARSAVSAETRGVLSSLQRRVRGLAMLHQSLYAEADSTQVNARDLINAVASDSVAFLSMGDLTIEKDLASVALYPDQAVPLSMWVAEALTNALKYVGRDVDGKAFISMVLDCDKEGNMTVKIENSIGTPVVSSQPEKPGDDTGGGKLGTTLMLAFSRQLGGEASTHESDTRYTRLLRFKVFGFDPDANLEMPKGDETDDAGSR